MATSNGKRDEIKRRLEEAKKRIDDALKNLPNATDKELNELDRDTSGGGGARAFVDFNSSCS